MIIFLSIITYSCSYLAFESCVPGARLNSFMV